MDSFELKRPRSYEKYDKKGNHFGDSKAPKMPISLGEEYIVTIEEMGKEGSGVALLCVTHRITISFIFPSLSMSMPIKANRFF